LSLCKGYNPELIEGLSKEFEFQAIGKKRGNTAFKFKFKLVRRFRVSSCDEPLKRRIFGIDAILKI